MIVAQEMIKRETAMDGNSTTYLRNKVARSKTTKKKQQVTQARTCWLNAIPREDRKIITSTRMISEMPLDCDTI